MKNTFKVEIDQWETGEFPYSSKVYIEKNDGSWERIGFSEWSGKVSCGTYMPKRFTKKRSARMSNLACIGNHGNAVSGAFGIIKQFLWNR